jgi:hypothetical protein
METIFSSVALPCVSYFWSISFLTDSKSRHAAHSKTEPLAMSKNRQRSAAVKRSITLGDVQDRSPGRSNWSWSGSDFFARSKKVSTHAANARASRYTNNFSWSNMTD